VILLKGWSIVVDFMSAYYIGCLVTQRGFMPSSAFHVLLFLKRPPKLTQPVPWGFPITRKGNHIRYIGHIAFFRGRIHRFNNLLRK